jgi:hypothetical protein
MENSAPHVPKESTNEPVQFWGPFIYLAFFIFFNLVLLPEAPAKIRMRNYDIEMIVYGAAGIFTGMLIYRIIKNTPTWVKLLLVCAVYGIILIRLIDEWRIFTVPGNPN